MQLIDGKLGRPRESVEPGVHPGAVAPFPRRHAVDDRGGAGRRLGLEGIRIGLERDQLAARTADLVLVAGSGRHAREEDLPDAAAIPQPHRMDARSEEHTSELQSLMRISYAVFCLKKKTTKK